MLTVDDVLSIKLEKARRNHETYKELLRKCYDKIKQAAEAAATHTTYSLPAFIIDRPSYTMQHAMRYIVDKLRLGGFNVTVLGENRLHVDWSTAVAALTPKRTVRKDPHRQLRNPHKAATARHQQPQHQPSVSDALADFRAFSRHAKTLLR